MDGLQDSLPDTDTLACQIIPMPFLSVRQVKYWVLIGEMLESLIRVLIFKCFLDAIK